MQDLSDQQMIMMAQGWVRSPVQITNTLLTRNDKDSGTVEFTIGQSKRLMTIIIQNGVVMKILSRNIGK